MLVCCDGRRIDALDVGCGSGHAVNLMAERFPRSRFVGLDISPEGLAAGTAEAADQGLTGPAREAGGGQDLSRSLAERGRSCDHALIMTRRRTVPDTAPGLGLLAAGAAITVLVHVPRTRAAVQRLDDRWYALVQRSRSAPLTAASKTLDVGFGTTVDWTVRVAVTAQLVRRRRWAALTAWAATIALGEVSVGPLKAFVDRTRPLDPRTTTSMMSYPSGHALAAATTAPGIVLALVPPGPARRRALAVAIPLAGATALSRTYLNAHWLSDVLGGFALGTGYALAAPRVVDRFRRRRD